MFDMHQGFSGDELSELPPTVATVAVAQLDVVSSLARGRFGRAARQQLDALRVAGRLALATVRAKVRRRSA